MTKCASNSIEAILSPYCEIILTGSPFYRHLNYRKYARYVRPLIAAGSSGKELETICVFREPVSWLYSWYRFRQRFSLQNTKNPGHSKSTAGIGFEDFITAYVSVNRPPYANLGCQFDFVRTMSGNVGVNRIFLYENLDNLVNYFSAKVGKNLVLPKLNISPPTQIRTPLGALFFAGKRAVAERLRLPSHAQTAKSMEVQLPSDLYSKLRSYIPQDFELYDHLRAAP